MEKDLNIAILNDIYGALLTENQRDMIHSYYDCDLSLGEIAENSGISRQAVRDSVNKAKEALTDFERKLGTKDKLDKIKSVLSDCINECDSEKLKRKLTKLLSEI